MKDDLISRRAAIDAIFSEPLYKSGMKKRDVDVVVPVIYEKIKSLPSAQPEREGTRLSTVCLLCGKPAVTFNTEDDIPYTNYSYCEDCLRKGLKLLKAQKKNLKTQLDNDRIWEALSKVYNMADVPDAAKAIIGDVMLELDEPSAQPEIVRCKDCRYHIPQDWRCRLWCQFVDPLEWCSRAKRKGR